MTSVQSRAYAVFDCYWESLVVQHCHPVAAYVTFMRRSHAGITLHDEPLDWAAAGDHVNLTVTGMDIIKIKLVQRSCSRFFNVCDIS